jgi:aspartyl protease family protein
MKFQLAVFLISAILLNGCAGCSKSGIRHERMSEVDNTRSSSDIPRHQGKRSVVKMIESNGVYEVPVEINGAKMNFIFDTGASDITISLTEARFLYKQGTLTDSDFIGTQQYQIADGSITEGTKLNLKTVKIGNRTLTNVEASVVHNDKAPLLFGQSALAQFGKISIDYKKGEIAFE